MLSSRISTHVENLATAQARCYNYSVKDHVFVQLVVSFGLGLLLGLQRERTERSIAGIRTFPLIALFGTICAHLSQEFGGWILASGLISLAGLVVWANVAKSKAGDFDPGITTEVTAVLIFALGAYIAAGHMGAAVVVGGAVALVLQYKKPMHAFAGALGERDMRAIMLFVLLTLVILPVLPRGDFGPYGVWNPFEIWLMVVLIVAISLSGYVAYKLLGAKVGTWLGGILGGLISSTATTVSYARRTASTPQLAPLAALVIMIASCVSVARVLVEIAVVAPRSFPLLAAPIADEEIEAVLDRVRATAALETSTAFAQALARDSEALLTRLGGRFEIGPLHRIAAASVDRIS